MKKQLLVLFLLIIATSCRFYGVKGNGNVDEESRELDEFNKVSIEGYYDVVIYPGRVPGIEIEAEENLMDLIKTKVVNGRLYVKDKSTISPTEEIKIKIYTPELISLSSSDASSVFVKDLKTKRFELDVSGAGSIELTGKVKDFTVDLSGACELKAKNFKAKNTKIDISGASSAKVYASESFEASVSGVGEIEYYGNPKEISTDVSGVGNIVRK